MPLLLPQVIWNRIYGYLNDYLLQEMRRVDFQHYEAIQTRIDNESYAARFPPPGLQAKEQICLRTCAFLDGNSLRRYSAINTLAKRHYALYRVSDETLSVCSSEDSDDWYWYNGYNDIRDRQEMAPWPSVRSSMSRNL